MEKFGKEGLCPMEQKDKIITIPNILTMFRIVLIPFIVWAYCYKDSWVLTTELLVLSGVTDLADGFIARRFNMISNFGKAIDPVADKLTQFVTLICLVTKFPMMLCPCLMLTAKEIISGITAMMAIRKTGKVEGADWHGKVSTCLLYFMMIVHVVWYDINPVASNFLILICSAMMIVSFFLYNKRNIGAVKKAKS